MCGLCSRVGTEYSIQLCGSTEYGVYNVPRFLIVNSNYHALFRQTADPYHMYGPYIYRHDWSGALVYLEQDLFAPLSVLRGWLALCCATDLRPTPYPTLCLLILPSWLDQVKQTRGHCLSQPLFYPIPNKNFSRSTQQRLPNPGGICLCLLGM